MNQQPAPIVKQPKPKFGDRVRKIADHLKYESEIQVKATSHILSAAAKIAENHDHLIYEVVEMIEEDINQQNQKYSQHLYTVELLKHEFKTLRKAKAHFNLKANSWIELVKKLNATPSFNQLSTESFQALVIERFDAFESEFKIMRAEINQILSLLKQLVSE